MATHIIASTLPPKKLVEFNKYRIVKPAWVTDSINAGRLLPWTDYRVIDESPRQKSLKFEGGKMTSQSPQQTPLGYREQTQNSFYTNQLHKRASGATPSTPSPLARPTSSTLRQMEQVGDDETGREDSPSARLLQQGTPEDQDDIMIDQEQAESCQAVDFKETTGAGSDQLPNQGLTDGRPQDLPRKAMTSEEHNALLLSDPKIRKSSTANPDFLKQFYSESRLHHLSTWKAELKSKMQKLAAERGTAVKAVKRKPGSRRYIMHVDFDSFFCAVSLKRAPEYADKPAVVAHSTGTGSEIASCNYPARKFGVKNGMWMKKASELCPDIKVLPYDFPAYEEASSHFYECILDIGAIVQSVSVDEALLDITTLVLQSTGSDGFGVNEGNLWREQEKANDIATGLRQQIRAKTGCAVSIGIGGNILLAKVALRKAKPAGQYQIKPEEVLDILSDLKVEDLPGVAYSIGGKLEEIGVKLIKDIRGLSKERLTSMLGPKTGEKLWEYSRGIDKSEVGDQPVRKSVSAEVNWGIRFINQDEAEEFVMNLCKELERRLLNEQVKGKSLTMKIMRRSLDAPLDPPKHLGHGKCDTFNKSQVFGVATNSAELIGREAVSILRSFKFSPGDLRGIGVQLQKLEPLKATAAAPDGSQKRLSFGAFAPTSAKKPARAETIDDDIASPTIKPALGRDSGDPIDDDPLTPKKAKLTPGHRALALARAGEADDKARTPLNMTGTQFIMPANADPSVLAELPSDIRKRLTGGQKAAMTSRDVSPSVRSRTQSPALQDEIPPEIDLEVFSALPEDMKAEVLASYGQTYQRGQGRLAQTPRRDAAANAAPKKTPTKRGIRGMFSKARERQHDAEAGLRQTNFMGGDVRAAEDVSSVDEEIEDLDPEFLSELPEEVRWEVVEDHRRRRLAARSGLNVEPLQRRLPAADYALPGGQTRLKFPALPPQATFTSSALSSATDIKAMLNAWHRETRDEGPHQADVEMFEKYLAKVVTEEKNMDKARRLVLWLDWIVEEENSEGKGKQSWRSSVVSIKDEVQKAVKSRGLGPMKFG